MMLVIWSLPFQSTSSARRTTPAGYGSQRVVLCISIHVLREEDDVSRREPSPSPSIFQSTSSARRTTQVRGLDAHVLLISIHVLREEDDNKGVGVGLNNIQFQSTSSARRTTQKVDIIKWEHGLFQSTSSARRTTNRGNRRRSDCYDFNPRPPRGGRQIP